MIFSCIEIKIKIKNVLPLQNIKKKGRKCEIQKNLGKKKKTKEQKKKRKKKKNIRACLDYVIIFFKEM